MEWLQPGFLSRDSPFGAFELVRPSLQQAHVGFQTVVQPATDEVARRPAATNHLVVASSSAEVSRPAASARLLTLYMAVGEPTGLPITGNATCNVLSEAPHRPRVIAHEPMTCGEVALGGNA